MRGIHLTLAATLACAAGAAQTNGDALPDLGAPAAAPPGAPAATATLADGHFDHHAFS